MRNSPHLPILIPNYAQCLLISAVSEIEIRLHRIVEGTSWSCCSRRHIIWLWAMIFSLTLCDTLKKVLNLSASVFSLVNEMIKPDSQMFKNDRWRIFSCKIECQPFSKIWFKKLLINITWVQPKQGKITHKLIFCVLIYGELQRSTLPSSFAAQ